MAAARVLLLLSGRPESVGFAQSVCGLLGAGSGPGPWPTHCGWKPGQLLLSDRPFPGASARLPLQRPPFCPFAALDQRPWPPGTELPTGRGVDLGVAVILQSSDQTVLLTRRTRTLRVFPNLWVPPGGHVELEELLDGGLRELREESGLQLPTGQFSWVPLGLWEESEQQLQVRLAVEEGNQGSGGPRGTVVLTVTEARIRPNPSEVSAFAWLGADVAAAVAATEDGTETPGLLSQELPPSVPAVEIEEDGGARPLALPVSTLLRTTPATTEDTERVSTGTKFALGLWLQHLGRQSGAHMDAGCAKEVQTADPPPRPTNQESEKPSA